MTHGAHAVVTYETKVWEGDWRKVLRPECLGTNIARCNMPLKRTVLINNVDNPTIVADHCNNLHALGLIDLYVQVDHYALSALTHFELKAADFGDGYRYSIAELVSIYTCQTPYLLHFSGDSMISPDTPPDWLSKAIRVLESNPVIACVNLSWNNRHDEVAANSFAEDDDCFYGYGFSDQMYLIRTKDFIFPIYSNTHPGTAAHHHGEIFEKRVDAWMRCTHRPRATLKLGSYIHPTYGE